MRIPIDMYDALGNRQGDGPLLSCISASVKRALDGAGSIKLEFPATDSRVLELIRNERRVRIFLEQDSGLRELGRGVIRNVKVNVAESGTTISADGTDTLDALTRRSVLLNRKYTNQTIADIANSLVSLVPGWSAVVESGIATNLQSARFDGTSVLKALIRVADEKGIHLREGTEPNTVELGVFGAQTDIVITNVGNVTREIQHNDNIILIEKLSAVQDSEAVANWIVPLGAGEGQAALTLKNSSRTSPYTIGTMDGADGQTLYYLKDNNSIAANDQIEKIVTFKSIAPLSNSDSAKQLAANALYDASASWLERNSQRQYTYAVSGVKLRQRIRPGDKIKLVYKGIVYRDNQPVIPLEVDDYFWVLSVTEKVSDSGVSVDLEISNIDKHFEDAAQIVVGALEAIDVRNVAVQTYPTWCTYFYKEPVQASPSGVPTEGYVLMTPKFAKFPLQIDSDITDVIKVKLNFRTEPLYTFTTPFLTTNLYYTHDVRIDNDYPCDLHLFINSVDVSNALGGPWAGGAATNAAVDVTVDITDFIVNAPGGIYQRHNIQIRSLTTRNGIVDVIGYAFNVTGETSHGMVEASISLLGVTQAII